MDTNQYFASLTHVGKVRKSNQDSIFVDQNNRLFIVADGMGGHLGGDIASQMCINLIPEYIQNHAATITDPLKLLEQSIQHCNKKIYEKSLEDQIRKGMGTTAVIGYFDSQWKKMYLASVGDSRCYLIHQNCIFQLTTDHTLVQEKINMGIYTRERAATDPAKNILVKAVGHQEELEIDLFEYNCHSGDLFLLCSDGLYGEFSDRDLLRFINHYVPTTDSFNNEIGDTILKKMLEKLFQGTCKDNLSAILIQVK